MSKIILDASELEDGMVIEEAVKIPADVTVSCSEYLCLLLRDRDGNKQRAMFPVGYTIRPAPHHAKMLRLYHKGSRFFSLDEIVARENGDHIVERPTGTLVEGQRTVEQIWSEKGNQIRLGDEPRKKKRTEIEI